MNRKHKKLAHVCSNNRVKLGEDEMHKVESAAFLFDVEHGVFVAVARRRGRGRKRASGDPETELTTDFFAKNFEDFEPEFDRG